MSDRLPRELDPPALDTPFLTMFETNWWAICRHVLHPAAPHFWMAQFWSGDDGWVPAANDGGPPPGAYFHEDPDRLEFVFQLRNHQHKEGQ